MTEHTGLPVKGYQPQSEHRVELVNRYKEIEERLLRELDDLQSMSADQHDATGTSFADHRWIAVARTHFQQGFMALNRSVFQPARIKLPEDE